MAVQDIRSNLRVIQIATDEALPTMSPFLTQITTAEVDTANFELGLMLAATVTADIVGDTGFIGFAESAVSGGPYTNITDTNFLIGSGELPATSTVDGGLLTTIGLISNQRYVVATLISSAAITAGTVTLSMIEKGEQMPVVD